VMMATSPSRVISVTEFIAAMTPHPYRLI